jgi:putative endonuclease
VAEWYTCLPAGRRVGLKNMYYVYILQNLRTKQYYKGLTDNVSRRLNQHNKNKVKFTQNKHPLRLIHVEICNDRNEARKMELFFETGFGREII